MIIPLVYSEGADMMWIFRSIGVCKIRQRGEMENTKGIRVEKTHYQLESNIQYKKAWCK